MQQEDRLIKVFETGVYNINVIDDIKEEEKL